MRNWRRHRDQTWITGGCHQIGLPAGPQESEALILEKAVARRCRSGDADIEEAPIEFVPAVNDLSEHYVVALALVDRHQDLELCGILDKPSGIERR